MAFEWYIIHTYTGFEQRVKEVLEERAKAEGFENDITEIMIPTENVVERRKGKTITTTKKFYPGYILAKMNFEEVEKDDGEALAKQKNEHNAKLWAFVKNTPHVTGFVGPGSKPTPVPKEEVHQILRRVSASHDEPPKIRHKFAKGDNVRIVEGPFMDFTGVVEEVQEDRKTLKIMVTIFGRATPVEVDFLHTEKV